MVPRPYVSPFETPAPIFQSGAAGGLVLRKRIGALRSAYRRALLAATLASFGLHGIALYGLRNVSAWAEPEPFVGYREGIEVIELAEIDPELPNEREIARPRPPSGALVAVEYVTEPDRETARSPEPTTTPTPPPPKLPVFEAPPPIAETPEVPIRIELREDWSLDPTSPAAAFATQFQPLRIVVPEYPDLAFEQDIQGLVRLEADVGISGKVLDVRVLESPDGGLALAAARALLLWEFQPFQVRGRARPFRIVVPFRFRIEN